MPFKHSLTEIHYIRWASADICCTFFSEKYFSS